MKKFLILLTAAISLVMMQAAMVQKEPVTKADLGQLLFFDPLLSRDRTVSCASCHKPEFAFADNAKVSRGVNGQKGNRNTPTAMNITLNKSFFWDGRALTLEEQALAPIENTKEMNLPIDEAIARLRNSKTYRRYFQRVFEAEPTRSNLAEAIAAFERTLETSDSPFDRWKFSEDSNAVSQAVKRGFAVFSGKGKCGTCHFGADLTTHEFRNIGLFNGKELKDSGRAVVTGIRDDIGKFKTPGLRNIAMTAPYMHNGMFKTLNEVIEFYNDPGKMVRGAINRDTMLNKPLGLTTREKRDLEAFLNSLTDKRFMVQKGYLKMSKNKLVGP